MRKKKRYMPAGVIIAVVLGFTVLYMGSMGLATLLAQDNFRKEHQETLKAIARSLDEAAQGYVVEAVQAGREIDREWMGTMLEYLFGIYGSWGELPYMLWSGAVWDENSQLLAQSGPICFSVSEAADENEIRIWNLEDVLDENELEELVKYSNTVPDHEQERYTSYDREIGISDDGQLAGITVFYDTWTRTDDSGAKKNGSKAQKYEWEEGGEKKEVFYVCTDSGIAWQWKNEDVNNFKILEPLTSGVIVPGMTGTVNKWPEWKADDYLRGFPEKTLDGYRSAGEAFEQYGTTYTPADFTTFLYFPVLDQDSTVRTCTLKLRMTSHSWVQAVEYMKYIYLGAALFLLGCMACVLAVLEKSYRKNAQTEEKRRDFINAVAHEMKTPLSVIRAFAENLQEETDAGKKEYYLQQMIGQTEEIDAVVKEMIQVSKLNKDDLAMKKEVILLSDFLEKEVRRIAPRTDRKHIKTEIRCPENLSAEVDVMLFEKAVRCLLDNAVSYNRDGGWIRIEAEEGKFVIANSGAGIPEEEIPHVCEMMWRGEKDRGKTAEGEKHFGMGLYLAERIFHMHEMKLKVENIPGGVQVIVTKIEGKMQVELY